MACMLTWCIPFALIMGCLTAASPETLGDLFKENKRIWKQQNCTFPDPSTYDIVDELSMNITKPFEGDDIRLALAPCKDQTIEFSFPGTGIQNVTTEICMATFHISRMLCTGPVAANADLQEKLRKENLAPWMMSLRSGSACNGLRNELNVTSLSFLGSSQQECQKYCEQTPSLAPLCRLLTAVLQTAKAAGNRHRPGGEVRSKRESETNDDGRAMRKQQKDNIDEANKRRHLQRDHDTPAASQNTQGDRGRHKGGATSDQRPEADVRTTSDEQTDPQEETRDEDSRQLSKQGNKYAEDNDEGNSNDERENDKTNDEATNDKSHDQKINGKTEPTNNKSNDESENEKTNDESMKDKSNNQKKTWKTKEKTTKNKTNDQKINGKTERTNDKSNDERKNEKTKDEPTNDKSIDERGNEKTNDEKTRNEDFAEEEGKASEKPDIPPDGVVNVGRLLAPEEATGHFMAYFVAAAVLCIAGYVVYHQKRRIIACILEGRREVKRRQETSSDRGAKYTKVKTSVEDVMPSVAKSTTHRNFVY